jgi:hypothetical protein
MSTYRIGIALLRLPRSLEPIVRALADIFYKNRNTYENDLYRVTSNFDDAARKELQLYVDGTGSDKGSSRRL